MLKFLILLILINLVCCANYYQQITTKVKEITRSSSKIVIKNIVNIWYFNNKCDISAVVFGKTGVGKSTIINSLFNFKEAQTGDFEATTKFVSKFSKIINGVKVNIYDTPGLFDENNDDRAYLKMAFPLLRKCDIILLCFDVREKRLRQEDITIIEALTKTFGDDFWTRAIIVYTFSDEVSLDFLKGKTKVLEKFMSSETYNEVPIIPSTEKTLLWTTIFKRADDKINSALIKLNFDTLYDEISRNKEKSMEIFEKIQKDQSIPYEVKQKLERKIRSNGCFASDTIVKLCSGKSLEISLLKVGDFIQSQKNKCSKVFYIKHHIDLYKVYRYAGVWLTQNHLVKSNISYYKVSQLSNITGLTGFVSHVLTCDDHILINNVEFSVHSSSHYFKSFLSKIIQLFY